jgi:hypothetical protein
MFRTVERGELDAGRLEQQIDRADALAVAAGVVRQQTDALSLEQVE